MKTLSSSFLLLAISFSCLCQQQPSPQFDASSLTIAGNKYQHVVTYKIIEGINQTFGYDIFLDGKLKIHQPTIPCHSGKEGFRTKIDADRIAQLVVNKVKKGEMPPTVTKEELKELGVRVPLEF